jgi:hypothetical protein
MGFSELLLWICMIIEIGQSIAVDLCGLGPPVEGRKRRLKN